MTALAGRVVAITGASAGIGRAAAIRLAAAGARVAISARRADRLQEIAADIRSRGGDVLVVPGDVTREADMHALVAATVGTFGSIDVMICNAGIGYHGSLDETTTEAMRRLVDVNILGTLYAAQAALVVMRRQGYGHIIAISSIVGRRGVGGSSVYAATKAAQVAFIESLRAEFVGTTLQASVILPVSTTSEFRDAMARDFGHRVSGHGPRQSPDAVARAIVACVRSPRPEVYPMRASWLLALLGVIAPALADRVVQRFGRRRTTPPSGT